MKWPSNWRKHKSKKQKELRKKLYKDLINAGYCFKAAKRARDFKTAKIKRLCKKFNQNFNIHYKNARKINTKSNKSIKRIS